MNLADLLGLKHWNEAETRALLDLAKSEGLIEGFYNHNRFGAFDFKANEATTADTFDIGNGQILVADEFGNYIAGYGSTYAGGFVGYWGVRAGGIAFDFWDNILHPNTRVRRDPCAQRRSQFGSFDWDADSAEDIYAGAERARREIYPLNPWIIANSPVNQVNSVTINLPP